MCDVLWRFYCRAQVTIRFPPLGAANICHVLFLQPAATHFAFCLGHTPATRVVWWMRVDIHLSKSPAWTSKEIIHVVRAFAVDRVVACRLDPWGFSFYRRPFCALANLK